jgi:hypothetical protein
MGKCENCGESDVLGLIKGYDISILVLDHITELEKQIKDLEQQLDDKNIMYWDMVDSFELERNKPLKVKIIDSVISYLKE